MTTPLLPLRLATLPDFFHAPARPAALPGARVVAVSTPAAALLGLDAQALREPPWRDWLAGNAIPPGSTPLASAYAGHQFGVYVPRLGDGRAILLGERKGTDGQRWEVQIKGAGPTVFSRGADGRVGLRAALRELFLSEALAALGVPTARVLAVLAGTLVVPRDGPEPAAVVVRCAPTLLRFGHVEYAHWSGGADAVRTLADHVLAHHLPGLAGGPDPYRALLEHAVDATARTVGLWQAYGFAHGVMNTDNMGLTGLTLDIGPTMFAERFTPQRAHNHSDRGGRYTLARQGAIGAWNLQALGHAMQTVVPLDRQHGLIERYEAALVAAHLHAMRTRLGLSDAQAHDSGAQAHDADLVHHLLGVLAATQADYPAFLRALCDYRPGDTATAAPLHALTGNGPDLGAWLAAYDARLAAQDVPDAARQTAMRAVNPMASPRTAALDSAAEHAAAGDDAAAQRVLDALVAPFTPQPGTDALSRPAPPGEFPQLSCLT